MDLEDPVDLDEELGNLLPAFRHTVCVRTGPELLRKRPDTGHPAAAADIGRPSQSPTAVSARSQDMMLAIAEPERPAT